MLRPRSSGRGFESPCRQHNPDTFFAHENTSTVAFDNGSVASITPVGPCDGYCSIVVSTSRCGRDILGSTPGSSKNVCGILFGARQTRFARNQQQANYNCQYIKETYVHAQEESSWPSGLRRCVQVAVFGRGFKSHR